LAAAWASRRKRSTKERSTDSSGKRTFSATAVEQRSWRGTLGHAAPRDQVVQFIALGEDTRRLVGIHGVKAYACYRSVRCSELLVLPVPPRPVGVLTGLRQGRRRGSSSSRAPRWRRRVSATGWRAPRRPPHLGIVGRSERDHPVVGQLVELTGLGRAGLGRHVPRRRETRPASPFRW